MGIRKVAVAAILALTIAPAAACGGDTSASSQPKTLTYWASNQGASVEVDKKVLQPELDKFQQQTGIKVNLEVVPWSDLLNRILAAATSGQGPDVVNIGNTWSASLQATGALVPFDDNTLQTLGGKDRFLPTALAATGAKGQPPTAVPLYSLAYGLYYNKKMFAAAGISKPPATWTELVDDGKKLTTNGTWGMTVEGGSITENMHHAFTLGEQHGGGFFDASGKPQFDTPQNVAAVKQYVDLLASDKIVNPANAEYSNGTEAVKEFATGKSAMLMWQTAASSLKVDGMSTDDYGVAPVPFPDTMPSGGKKVDSMVAGINMAVFNSTHNRDGALQFAKFMTSVPEQQVLNKAYGSLPPVKDAYNDPAFSTPDVRVFQDILANSSAPLPQIPSESQFETLVGSAMKTMFADAAAGKPITDDYVRAKLHDANEQMKTSG